MLSSLINSNASEHARQPSAFSPELSQATHRACFVRLDACVVSGVVAPPRHPVKHEQTYKASAANSKTAA